ncbi:PP2C family protein-serine/threonine phosphatase [Streptomyces sp. 900105755]
MRQARDHGGSHWPLRPLRKPGTGPGTPVPRRAFSQLAAGMPVAPVLIVLGIALLDVVGGSGMFWLPLLAAGPALAASTNGHRGVLCVGFLAAVLGATLGAREAGSGRELAAVLSALVAVTLASALASALRGRRERVLAAVRSVAEAAQHAVLKPIPETVGPFRVAVRYSAAAAEARIGGDLYALVPTPHGVRLIVGDVRGKGLPAVEIAALVLGVFREAAYDEPDLLAVVARIERSLARNLGPDDFVTAIVVGHPRAGQLEVVNCGHASPLLITASEGVTAVEATRPAPPLGLRVLVDEPPCLEILPFAEGDQLLLYTDGVIEARDRAREFYPLAERVARHVSGDPEHTLSAVHDELLAHVGGRLHDDAALLLLRMQDGAEPVPPASEEEEGGTAAVREPEGRGDHESVPVVSRTRSVAFDADGGRRFAGVFSSGAGR